MKSAVETRLERTIEMTIEWKGRRTAGRKLTVHEWEHESEGDVVGRVGCDDKDRDTDGECSRQSSGHDREPHDPPALDNIPRQSAGL